MLPDTSDGATSSFVGLNYTTLNVSSVTDPSLIVVAATSHTGVDGSWQPVGGQPIADSATTLALPAGQYIRVHALFTLLRLGDVQSTSDVCNANVV